MRQRLVGIIVGVVLVAATAPGVAATTTRTACPTSEGMPVETAGTVAWDGTVMQVRGLQWDIAGTSSCIGAYNVHIDIDYDLDVATGLGSLWGTDTIALVSDPDSGFFNHWWGTFAGGMPPYWSGKGVGHGFGAYEGWQYREFLGNHPTDPPVMFLPGQ